MIIIIIIIIIVIINTFPNIVRKQHSESHPPGYTCVCVYL